ncbi:MAG: uroporphyrinogen-III synthase [Acidobacteriia bacterium]|nr:uroporphyrinogen-III synthase [Terriglobia bacterium]
MASVEKPLAGKRIVLTRAPEQAREWARALEQMGAEVILLPTVAFAPPEDWRLLDEQLRRLDVFDAILFLSKNAVRYVLERLNQLGIKFEMLQSPNRIIAAVGPGTAGALTAQGVRVDHVAEGRTGEALAGELRQSLKGRKVLLPRSDKGDDRVLHALREAGAEVTEVIAYRTTTPASLDPAIVGRIRRADVDAIVFASPSAYHNLSDALGPAEAAALSSRVHFVAIGPTTARAMRQAGARVEIEASEASAGAAGLAASIAKFYGSAHVPAGKRALPEHPEDRQRT